MHHPAVMTASGDKILTVSALLCLSMSSFGQSSSPSRGSFRILAASAERASAENRLSDAVRIYRQALKMNPSWKEGWWGLGTSLYDQAQYRDAQQAFEHLTALDSASGSARLFLGLCQFELGDDTAALDNIRRARGMGIPNDPQLRRVTLYDEAQLELKKSTFETAIETLKLLNREGAHAPDVRLAWGMAMLRMRPQQLPPEESTDRVIVLRVGEAQELAAAKRFDEAKQAYEQVVSSAPDFPAIHYAYGRFLLDANEVEGAVNEFQQEIRNDPKNVIARLQIAAVRYRTDSAAGVPLAEEAVKLAPQLPLGHYLLGLLYLDTDSAAKAIPELKIAQKVFPNEPKIYFALGSAYAKVGRKEDAARARAIFTRLSAGSGQSETKIYGEEPFGTAQQQIGPATEKPH